MRSRNYKGIKCECGTEVSIGSKSGLCKSCSHKGKTLSQVHRENIAKSKIGNKHGSGNKGNKISEKHKEKLRQYNLGLKHSKERRLKNSLNKRGAKSHFWKGGVHAENRLLRTRLEYRIWRDAVFQRDKYTCQHCFVKGVYLNADHIKPFSMFPEERYNVSNGRTLCVPCHVKTDTYGGKMFNYETPSASEKDSTE